MITKLLTNLSFTASAFTSPNVCILSYKVNRDVDSLICIFFSQIIWDFYTYRVYVTFLSKTLILILVNLTTNLKWHKKILIPNPWRVNENFKGVGVSNSKISQGKYKVKLG